MDHGADSNTNTWKSAQTWEKYSAAFPNIQSLAASQTSQEEKEILHDGK